MIVLEILTLGWLPNELPTAAVVPVVAALSGAVAFQTRRVAFLTDQFLARLTDAEGKLEAPHGIPLQDARPPAP